MNLFASLGLVGTMALAVGLNGAAQREATKPFIRYGMTRISLGMTTEQVEQHLSQAGRHLQLLADKETALVYQNGVTDDFDGQITFAGGRVIYADYQMANAHSADELAQEIAGAVDSMESKTCTISNYAAHGTGGGFSESEFECDSQRFTVHTSQLLGSSARIISVNLEIGQTVAK